MPEHNEGGGRGNVTLEKMLQLRQILLFFSLSRLLLPNTTRSLEQRLVDYETNKKDVRSDAPDTPTKARTILLRAKALPLKQ